MGTEHTGGPPTPSSFLSRTAPLFRCGATGTSGQQNFNAKWAKKKNFQRFLLIQWIDFLLRSVRGTIINVYLFLMAVYKAVHVLWASQTPVPVTARPLVRVMSVHTAAIAPFSACPQRTPSRRVVFDRRHLQAVAPLAQHYANKSCGVWQ